MPGNIFDQFDAPQQPASAPNPYVVQPNPMRVAQQQAEEERKRAADARAADAAVRAAQASGNANAAADRAAREWAATHNPDGSPKASAKAPTVEQGKAAGFLARARAANTDYGKLGDIGPRSLPGEALNNAFPNVSNTLSGTNRQLADQAERAFVAAVLRLDSGAAIPPQEFVTQGQIYFPRPGDSPEVIAQKARARETALQSLALQAGSLADNPQARGTPQQQGESVQYSPVIPGGLTGSVTDDRPTSPTPPGDGGSGLAQFANGVGAGAGDIIEGFLNNTVGLLANPVSTTIARGLGYDNYTADIGQGARNLLGLPEGNPTVSAINQAASSGLGLGAGARALSRVASGVGQRALAEFGSRPIMDFIGGAGAGAGSELARASGGGPFAQALAAMGGGVLGGGVAAGLNLGSRVPSAVMRAADQHQIPMLAADVGGVGSRMASGAVGSTFGGIPLADASTNAMQAAAAARGRMASRLGVPSDITGAGQAAQRGARDFIGRSAVRGGDLFDAISVPAKNEAVANNTRAALSEIIQGFESNPQLSKIWTGHPRLKATLEALTPRDVAGPARTEFMRAADDLERAQDRYGQLIGSVSNPSDVSAAKQAVADAKLRLIRSRREMDREPVGGTISWEDMKRLRSIVGEIIGQPSLTSDGAANAAMRKFYAALTQDMEATAGATSPRALTEFRRANQYWRGRQDRIDNVLSSILGSDMSKGDEAAFNQINRWAQQTGGDFNRLSRMIRSLPEDEANTVRATIIDRMGNSRAGQQNAEGTEFSPAVFVTQWNNLAPRAKSVLFPNATHRADLNKLAKVMGAMKQADQFTNYSRTALSSNAMLHAGGVTIAPITTAILASGEFAAGKLLASPRFARWLATEPAPGNRRALESWTKQLPSIAAKSPIIANDLAQLGERLGVAFTKSPLPLAAEEEPNNRRSVPPRQ